MNVIPRRLFAKIWVGAGILLWAGQPFLSAWGQEIRTGVKFSNISINDGLSQSSPNCIFQDSRGFIWIGTDDGLNKYDGYTFTVYKPEQGNPNSLSNSRILSIAEDAKGNLWIGTNGGGVNRYDRRTDKFVSFMPGAGSLAGSIVRCILPCPGGDIWMGTDKGLSIYRPSSNSFIDPVEVNTQLVLLKEVAMNDLVLSRKNIVFAGTDNGLFSYFLDKKALYNYLNNITDEQSLPGNRVTALVIDSDDQLWLGTDNGLSRMEINGYFTRFTTSASVGYGGSSTVIRDMMEDNEGNLWIATYGNGVDVMNRKTGSLVNYSYDYNNPYSLRSNEVLSVFKDFSGVIWVGSNGIDTYNPQKEKFNLYDYVPYTRERLVYRNIHPIYEDADRVLWIGSKSDGLFMLDRQNKVSKRWLHDPGHVQSISSNRLRAICEFPRGILWVGTEDKGLIRISLSEDRLPSGFKRYTADPGNANSLTSDKIYNIYPDKTGNLWIGTDQGLTIMDTQTETFRQFRPDSTDPKSLSHNTVYTIFGDSKGNIWLATDMGVNRFDPSSGGFIRYIHNPKNASTLIHNEILSFCEDNKGNLWIGTYGKGIDRLNPETGRFDHFTGIAELNTAVVYGILEDDAGRLWLSSNNGILRFNPESLEVNQFNIEDGLQSNEFNGTSYFKSFSGEMFFGGQYGFNSFYPKDVIVDSIPPRIVLADLQIRNESISPGEDSPIKFHINETKEIVLNYKQNNFTLYFSALHYANPELNHYRYKLEGFDDEWIDVGSKRFVSYTSLPYRTYTFRVIAANADGVWNNEGLSVKIKVKPPFWATVFFKIFMALLFVAVLIYLVRRQISATQKQKKILEEKFRSSSNELEEARRQLEAQHDEIILQKRELKTREKDQENLLWFNQGLGLFSELFSKTRNDLDKLCHVTIEKLVEYVDAQQGGIFLLKEENVLEPVLELTAHYAFSTERANQSFGIGEGFVGACFKDKHFLEVDNLTENYTEFKSGLGGEYLKHLLLAPLIVNEACIGVIELASFKKLKGYRISFIEKLLENFASIISTEQATNRLKSLIDKYQQQSKDLEDSEEQLRINLEEIMAAQQESNQREDELIKLAEEAATREEMLNQQIQELKEQLEALKK